MEILKDVDQSRKKKVKCNICGRDMEAPKEENPPYWCYKCEDAIPVGLPHERNGWV